MIQRFTGDTELTIVTNLNEIDEPEEETELFRKGAVIEFDIIDHPQRFDAKSREMVTDESLINIQFGDGSMAFGVDKEWLEDVPKTCRFCDEETDHESFDCPNKGIYQI